MLRPRQWSVAGSLVFIVGDAMACRLMRTEAVFGIILRSLANSFVSIGHDYHSCVSG
jgi:hypothetical protein